MSESKNSKLIRSRDYLWNAWALVRNNALKSESSDTRNAVKAFQKKHVRNIEIIHRKLRTGKFSFEGGQAKLISKKDSTKKRGIVSYPMDVRIVQRSILDVLSKTEFIKSIEAVSTSFGAISKGEEHSGGCDKAIEFIKQKIKTFGDCYYLKSDIENFFNKIPQDKIIKILSEEFDKDFVAIIKEASNSELINFERISEENRSLFPWENRGFAQGLSLSPLFGNIFLNEFDKIFNSPDVCCVRYLDDLLFLGKDKAKIASCFEKARTYLKKKGFKCYSPGDKSGKASEGYIRNGLEYLGYEIYLHGVRPSKENQQKLLQKIRSELRSSMVFLLRNMDIAEKEQSMLFCMSKINKILSSWSGAFVEANDDLVKKNLDRKIFQILEMYLTKLDQKLKIFKSKDLFSNYNSLLGIPVLSKKDISE